MRIESGPEVRRLVRCLTNALTESTVATFKLVEPRTIAYRAPSRASAAAAFFDQLAKPNSKRAKSSGVKKSPAAIENSTIDEPDSLPKNPRSEIRYRMFHRYTDGAPQTIGCLANDFRRAGSFRPSGAPKASKAPPDRSHSANPPAMFDTSTPCFWRMLAAIRERLPP